MAKFPRDNVKVFVLIGGVSVDEATFVATDVDSGLVRVPLERLDELPSIVRAGIEQMRTRVEGSPAPEPSSAPSRAVRRATKKPA